MNSLACTITRLPGDTEYQCTRVKTISHIVIAENNDAHSNAEGTPRLFFRMPSSIPNLANTNPQNEVLARQKKVIHDSSAREVTVAAPPRRRLMAVTTNSAKNMIPPELPRSWPMVMNPITRVLSRRGLIIDSTPLAVVLRTISIDSRDKLIPLCRGNKKMVRTVDHG